VGCLFCEIIKGNILSKKVYEDDKVFAFEDINPQAPVHILIIPKEHIGSITDLSINNDSLMGYILRISNKIAEDKSVDKSGYRVVVNCGPDSGQAVFHIHFHLLGGRHLKWPPG